MEGEGWSDKLDFGRPPLTRGETLLATFSANSGLFGGRLLVTSIRVIFQPHRVSRLLGGRGWDVPRDSVSHAAPVGRFPRRIRLGFADGSRRTVVVSDPARATEMLTGPASN